MRVPYRIVIEPQEYNEYAGVINPAKILVLPFSNLGNGSIPARNWVWEHSISEGWERHWILDDNIMWFARMYDNKKIKVDNGICFVVVEDLVDRYENFALSGLQYEGFMVASAARKLPFVLNTRIYSCILIQNDIPFRWRGRYNEDTDLSLRVLKTGRCTILVHAFVCKKMSTMTMAGGNTEDLYKLNNGQDGRLLMAQSLQRQHPDVVRIKRRWGRWQHVVDYSKYRKNVPRLRSDTVVLDGINNYGMVLKK